MKIFNLTSYRNILVYYLSALSFVSCNNNDDSINEPMIANPNALIWCENGFAQMYPCNGYDLMTHIPLSDFNANSGNDSWGWTDTSTGKEYVLMGLDNGTAFVDITDTQNPVYLGKLPTETISTSWRDIKVYNNHAFIVADNAMSHGMQVFDLTRLRNVANPPQTFNADNVYNGIGSCHNVVINEDKAVAYLVGCDQFSGGPVFVDISDPVNPVGLGGYSDSGYTHDAQVITYTGPDTDYTGKEIFVGSNENEVVIVDVTDKTNPLEISTISYQNVRYAHQGWFTEDMKYFILGDEIDEISVGNNTRAIVFDFTDLDNPQHHFDYLANNPSTDHNGYIIGNILYQASYRAGLRVIDISNIANKSFNEIGYFDTFPANDNAITDGAWNVYPFFQSGNIVISDMNLGLLIVRSNTP